MVVQPAYESLEIVGMPMYVLKNHPRHWRYYKFYSACGFRIEEQPGNSDLYELVIGKKKELAEY
jgi:hypothetical protein